MWKRHRKELILFILSAILILVFLLLLVNILEYFEIHISGGIEIWIGLIGSIIGGCFTLFGVLITIYKQEDSDNENKRLLNLPILGFEVCDNEMNVDYVISCDKYGEISLESRFLSNKEYKYIKIKTVNDVCAFNFKIKVCLIDCRNFNYKKSFDYPHGIRIAVGECVHIAFDCIDMDREAFWLICFTYEDIFKNKYYQYLPITYMETVGIRGIRQEIEIRDLKQPIWEKNGEHLLSEIESEYIYHMYHYNYYD